MAARSRYFLEQYRVCASRSAPIPAALESLNGARAVFQHLSEMQPGDVALQYYLSLANRNLGLARRAEGQLGVALDNFKTALSILAPLVAAAPGNAQWQSDLADVNINIGEIQHIQGD